jgi:hypothetical protein
MVADIFESLGGFVPGEWCECTPAVCIDGLQEGKIGRCLNCHGAISLTHNASRTIQPQAFDCPQNPKSDILQL